MSLTNGLKQDFNTLLSISKSTTVLELLQEMDEFEVFSKKQINAFTAELKTYPSSLFLKDFKIKSTKTQKHKKHKKVQKRNLCPSCNKYILRYCGKTKYTYCKCGYSKMGK